MNKSTEHNFQPKKEHQPGGGIKHVVGRRTVNKYRCSKCKKVVNRKDERQWIKSFCEETGKYSRLIKT